MGLLLADPNEFGEPGLNYGLTPSPEEYRVNELIGDADTVLTALAPFGRDLELTGLVLFGSPRYRPPERGVREPGPVR